MVSIRLPEKTEKYLAFVAKKTKRTKSSLIRDALEQYLEDAEDLHDALVRISKPNREFYTTDQVRKMLGIERKPN